MTISAEDAAVQRNNPRSDDAFQRLLLKFSDAAAQGTPAQALIRLFCRATREFFQVDGAYFWQRVSADELVGAEADGVMADRFPGNAGKRQPEFGGNRSRSHPTTEELSTKINWIPPVI